eukprot:symbB.v1.2.016571.t1/scaffold1263.1/size128093/11
MESLQRLAALPLVDNACASRANRDSWTYSVFCREVQAAEVDDPDALLVSSSEWPVHVKLREVVAADLLKRAEPGAAIVAYSEWRSKFSEGQYLTLLFYHAFMFLEVEGGLAICTEKYNDKLELIFGEKQLLSTFARSYRATGDQRKPSTRHSQCKVERYVSLQDLVDWICGPLAIVWRPYCLINSNCQHYARDLVHFLSQDGASFAQLLCRDREVVLSAVQCEGHRLCYAHETLQDDRSLVMAAVATDGMALRFASHRLRAERQVCFVAVRQQGMALEFCAKNLLGDEELVTAAVVQDSDALQFASAALKQSRTVVMAAVGKPNWSRFFGCTALAEDEDVALTAIGIDWHAAKYISPRLHEEVGFMRRAIALNGFVIQLVPNLCAQRVHGLCAVRQNGLALEFLSQDLRGDGRLVREAIAQNAMALQFASEGLQSQRDLVLAAVVKHGHSLQFASDRLKEDPTLIITAARRYVFVDWPWLFTCDQLRNSHSAALGAVRADPNALRCLSLWWGDREVVLTAVQQQGMLLEFAKDLQADREVVLAAVRADGNALQMASWDLRKDPMVLSSAARKWWAFDWSILLPVRCDKVVVQAAVELDWRALEFASEDLKDDLDVLRAAVRQSCLAMRWASDAFKADKDKMCQVVNIKGTALQFASPHLKDDKDLVLAAVQQDGRSLQHASERLQKPLTITVLEPDYNEDSSQRAGRQSCCAQVLKPDDSSFHDSDDLIASVQSSCYVFGPSKLTNLVKICHSWAIRFGIKVQLLLPCSGQCCIQRVRRPKQKKREVPGGGQG